MSIADKLKTLKDTKIALGDELINQKVIQTQYQKAAFTMYPDYINNLRPNINIDNSIKPVDGMKFHNSNFSSQEITLDLVNVTDGSEMFSFTSGSILKLKNTNKITNCYRMFENGGYEIDLVNNDASSSITQNTIDLSNCVNAEAMFLNFKGTNVNVIDFNNTTTKLQTAPGMFEESGFKVIKGLDVINLKNNPINLFNAGNIDTFPPSLEAFYMKNFGNQADITEYSVNQFIPWQQIVYGSETSLKDKTFTYFIDNLYDRKANGLNDAYLYLEITTATTISKEHGDALLRKGWVIDGL